mgnify:FL=1|tara:strand:- start:18 stop:653 length:636 start_codon:yes stop_codon:yes gene_type:complete
MNTYNVITLFPKLVEEWKNIGIVRQAIKNELVNIQTTDLREYGIGDYKQVDDSPYGGGPGMVLMPEPLDNAIKSFNSEVNVFLTPSGEQLNEVLLMKLLSFKSINVIAGRYEGFDQRILDIHADFKVSIGHAVVSGGEVPAMYMLEALVRRIPGVLGNPESLKFETFNENKYDFPVYTRPETFNNLSVPEVLLSGNHKEIEEWKKNNLKDI